jgi:hypothetical protein
MQCIIVGTRPNEVLMSNIYVEREPDETYVAIQKKQVIARGRTQAEAAARAHRQEPDDPVLAERVRDTKGGSRDKWRRVYWGGLRDATQVMAARREPRRRTANKRDAALLAEIGESVEERAIGSDGSIVIDAAHVRWLLAKARGETANARKIADEPQLSPKSSRLIEDALHLAGVAARDDNRQLQRDADAAALALRRRVAQIERRARA